MSESRRSRLTFFNNSLNSTRLRVKQSMCSCTVLLLATSGIALSAASKPDSRAASQSASEDTKASAKTGPEATVSVPAGTNIALVLTQPIQSRYIHRGDDIYAQIVAPITRGSQVVIPEGTLVNGKFDKLGRHGDRGELYLQSMSIVFPDGYVAPVAGPIMLETAEGYAWKDPGSGRVAALVAGPLAGGALGALIGHAAASSQPTTLTSTLPPGCTGPPPGCLTSSVSGPPDKGKDTVIGATIGSGLGLAAGLLLVGTSHHFFLDAGTPVEMTLQHPLTLPEDQVHDAIRDALEHPAPEQPIEPLPQPPPPSPDNDPGTCWTPGTPGTPDIDIPGTPPVGDSPGTPAVHIPGTPGTPPTPHPCP
jgi:hypothetical protein